MELTVPHWAFPGRPNEALQGYSAGILVYDIDGRPVEVHQLLHFKGETLKNLINIQGGCNDTGYLVHQVHLVLGLLPLGDHFIEGFAHNTELIFGLDINPLEQVAPCYCPVGRNQLTHRTGNAFGYSNRRNGSKN